MCQRWRVSAQGERPGVAFHVPVILVVLANDKMS